MAYSNVILTHSSCSARLPARNNAALGVKWEKVSARTLPTGCKEIVNAKLKTALESKTEFTFREWKEEFGIEDDLLQSYVVQSCVRKVLSNGREDVMHTYFKPASDHWWQRTYIANSEKNLIHVLDRNGRILTDIACNGELHRPSAVLVDGTGNLIVADRDPRNPDNKRNMR